MQDKNSYNDFTKEIVQNQNAKQIYEKYKKLLPNLFLQIQ